jgi:tRNA-splicing ligase RtcB (3'-phosphate/5'-hydroxy nucleic acid ligase)
LADKEKLVALENWKSYATFNGEGFYTLQTEDIKDIPVRLFFTPALLAEAEDALYSQIVNATRFPGVKMVAITPDAHYGYGVPVGSVIITDGTVAMGPVGFDIGCGMVSAKSDVDIGRASAQKRLEFNQEVINRVEMGVGGQSKTRFANVGRKEFENLVRGGAEYYVEKYGGSVDRSRAERQRLPVDDDWNIPWGVQNGPDRGITQLGSLGGGNHFIELQQCEETDTLFVQAHTGSRGFGHGLATHFFHLAQLENPAVHHIDLGYFTPESRYHKDYLNAVAVAANYAILNRLILFEEIAAAFRKVFKGDLELIYEISHNLVQREWHPDFGDVWVHRKGATRAFPAGHPGLEGTFWADKGHPVLVPGSNKDYSFILRPLQGAVRSGFSVNHGAGRRMSRSQAVKQLSQEVVDRQYRHAGIVVNNDGKVPIDESSACYKPSEEVVDAVVKAGLAEIQYRLYPLASLKGTEELRRKSPEAREKKEQFKKDDRSRREARRTRERERGDDGHY